ncbi:alginate lyase-domain-containing protein [Mycena crocata]|nr:alginate lyase-domain-containing protein [Mycena crocata]
MGKPQFFTVPWIYFVGYVVLYLVTGAQASFSPPNTAVLDGNRLFDAKTRLALRDRALRKVLALLTTQADGWLTKGPWTVTSKTITPPGGDVHDYASQAPYWWPSNTSDGCPYFQRDGVRNPEVDLYTDHDDRGFMIQSSYILSLAWYYTGNKKYALKAGEILRTWFITPATRMNPNLNHAQIIPCANTGRSIGIIDFSQQYTDVIDAAAILATGAPGWKASDIKALHQWNVEYLDWLETSQFGIDETAAENNHGTFAIMQSAGVAMATGNTVDPPFVPLLRVMTAFTPKTLVRSKAELIKSRIDAYITANGSQPQELVRTRSWHYSTFDLIAYTRIAAIAKKVGVDLWRYEGPEGQSIQQAVNFILPAATGGGSEWAYPELIFDPYAASDIVHAASDAGNVKATRALDKLTPPLGGDLWRLRPAVEQLDVATLP